VKVIYIAEAKLKPRRLVARLREQEQLMIVDGKRLNPALFDDERDIDRLLEHHPAFRYTVRA
jgi:hypothetical protein